MSTSRTLRAFLLIMFTASAAQAVNPLELTDKITEVDRLVAQLHAFDMKASVSLKEAEQRLSDTPMMFQARLSGETNVPISTTDQSPGTVFVVPYKGNRIALYDGTNWVFRKLSAQISRALAGLNTGSNYDVFVYDNAGTPTVDAFVEWASDTARATALTTQNGVLVSSANATRRYVGTFRTTGAAQTQDTTLQRFVWSYYHRAPKILQWTETSNTWVYGSTTIRQTQNDANNDFEYVIGWEDRPIYTSSLGVVTEGTGTNRSTVCNCIGIDSTTACITDAPRGGSARSMVRGQLPSFSNHSHGLGYHQFSWLEAAGTNNNETFVGDAGGDGRVQTGFFALIWC